MSENTTHHPVILFPGIAGSRLQTRSEKNENLLPLWLNYTTPGIMNSSNQEDDLGLSSSSIVKSDVAEYNLNQSQTISPTQNWKQHMSLQSNGIDPIKGDVDGNIFNRPVEKLEGIKNVNYPLPGVKPKEANKYFQQLVEGLVETGYYTEDENIIGFSYDWRIAPGGLEKRYGIFANLKKQIEDLYSEYGLPVVLIAHSMGNRLIQYFLKWIETNESNNWIDIHIERYIAISPPWLGAPQSIYRVTDTPIVLGAGSDALALDGMKDVLQSFSSIPWLLPVTENEYKYFNTESFGYLQEDNSKTGDPESYQVIDIDQTLVAAEAEGTTQKHRTIFYEQNSLITQESLGDQLITCPPVKKLDVIYSTGFNTPVGAYYKIKEDTKTLTVATELGTQESPISHPSIHEKQDLTIIQGIILETNDTEQEIDLEFPDENSHANANKNSGDLVVPYASLVYFKKWKKDHPDKEITGHPFHFSGNDNDKELNHNAIIRHTDVVQKILHLLNFP